MQITKVNFPPIIDDNEELYYNLLISMLESADSECILSITKANTSIIIRVSPSQPELLSNLLQGIKEINTFLNIRVNFSKSIKRSFNITYSINLIPEKVEPVVSYKL